MTVVVFLGPSLAVAEARNILDAVYLPPAGQGDVLSALLRYQPHAIGLIDGVFHQSLSVWHKEILEALDKGVDVYGAASMGAIRAAETARFGTIGVGRVYDQYASGQIEDDDEVAVAHAGPEVGYRVFSDALVNIRATFIDAAGSGIIDSDTAARLVEIAKSLYFPERRIGRVLDLAETGGLPAAAIGRLRDFVKTGYVDLKGKDAELLLKTLRDRPCYSRRSVREPLVRSVYFEILENTDRRVASDGNEIDLASVGKHAAISEAYFEDVAFSAHNRRLAVLFSELTGIKPSVEDTEEATRRFRARFALEEGTALEEWCHQNDLTKAEYGDLMYTLACARALHRWSSYVARGAWARDVLDEMRLSNRYVDAKRRAASAERAARAADPAYDRGSSDQYDLQDMAGDQAVATGWRLDTDVRQWAEEVGFKDRDDFQAALTRAYLARKESSSSA